MIRFIDFAPRRTDKKGFFSTPKFESLEDVTDDLNFWKAQNPEDKIISIETVVLPNIHHSMEEGSEDPQLGIKDMSNQWYQVIRVWYHTDKKITDQNDFV